MAFDAKIFTGKVRERVEILQYISYESPQGVLEIFMKQDTLSRLIIKTQDLVVMEGEKATLRLEREHFALNFSNST